MSKEDWKKAGKGLGSAFAGLGKTLIRSAEQTIDDVSDWAKDGSEKKTEEVKEAAAETAEKAEETAAEAVKETAEKEEEKASTVYNDGSWRKTGKALGGAFADVGRAFIHTIDGGDKEPSETKDTDNHEEAGKE